jgi:hypothetical protein
MIASVMRTSITQSLAQRVFSDEGVLVRRAGRAIQEHYDAVALYHRRADRLKRSNVDETACEAILCR